jgi:hypothetical protein
MTILNCQPPAAGLLLAFAGCATTPSIPASHITTAHSFPYQNSESTPTHLLTHSNSGLEPGPEPEWTTPKIPATQLHTSPDPSPHFNTHLSLTSIIANATSAPAGFRSSCCLSSTSFNTSYCWVPFWGPGALNGLHIFGCKLHVSECIVENSVVFNLGYTVR